MSARTFSRVAAVLLLAAVIAYNVISSGTDKKNAAYVQGFDVLALPGEEFELRAKVEEETWTGLRPDVHGAQVEFFIEGRRAGAADSARDGIASIRCKLDKPGEYTAVAKLAGTSAYSGGDTFLVEVCAADTKFVVTDIDHTIADVAWTKFVSSKNEDVPALADSADVLSKFAKEYKVLYVTARDDAFMKKTRAWLELRKFPRGPAFFWDFLGTDLSHETYKTKKIAAFKKRFPNIVAGVGDLESDARPYIANGVKAIVVNPKHDEDLPKDAIWVKTWKEAERHLLPEK